MLSITWRTSENFFFSSKDLYSLVFRFVNTEMNEVHSSFLSNLEVKLCLSLSTRWLPNARRTTNSGIGILNLELKTHRFGRCSIDWTVCRESLNSFDSPLDDHHLRWHRWIVSDHSFVERNDCSCIGLSCVLCVVLWFTGLRGRPCLWKYVGESEREVRLCVYRHHFAFSLVSSHVSVVWIWRVLVRKVSCQLCVIDPRSMFQSMERTFFFKRYRSSTWHRSEVPSIWPRRLPRAPRLPCKVRSDFSNARRSVFAMIYLLGIENLWSKLSESVRYRCMSISYVRTRSSN